MGAHTCVVGAITDRRPQNMSDDAPGLEVDIYARLAEASLDDPSALVEALLSALFDQLGLLAASIYINSPNTEGVRLRGQVGFQYKAYKDFDLPYDSFPGEAVSRRDLVSSTDIATSPLYRDQSLLQALPIKSVVAIPLEFIGDVAQQAAQQLGAPDPLGAICLYPNEDSDVAQIGQLVRPYGPFVARMYLGALERAARNLRRKVVERVAYRKEIGSLAYNYLVLAREELSVEAAALWTLDARRNLLYRRKALAAKKSEDQGAPPFLRVNDKSLIARCFQENTPLIHDASSNLVHAEDVDLKCARPLANWMAMPISLPDDARLRGRAAHAAGVLELANHFTASGGVSHLTTPNWEDSYLVNFSCELLSVLTYQVLRTQDHESDYERLLHGAKTSIVAARSHLQSLDSFHLERYMMPKARHFIPNAIEWLEDFEAQLSRDDLMTKRALDREEIALYGDVLGKLPAMVKRMNTRDEERPLELHGFDTLALEYRGLPKVVGNRRALDCIFRNLMDNSRKYCQPPESLTRQARIVVSVEPRQRRVVVVFSDNGAPLPSDEAELIFEDGFRGTMAQGIRPQGVGRGLHTCKQLMVKMGGDILHMPDNEGVTFRLELPTLPPTR
jgi:hypothetical protein